MYILAVSDPPIIGEKIKFLRQEKTPKYKNEISTVKNMRKEARIFF